VSTLSPEIICRRQSIFCVLLIIKLFFFAIVCDFSINELVHVTVLYIARIYYRMFVSYCAQRNYMCRVKVRIVFHRFRVIA